MGILGILISITLVVLAVYLKGKAWNGFVDDINHKKLKDSNDETAKYAYWNTVKGVPKAIL